MNSISSDIYGSTDNYTFLEWKSEGLSDEIIKPFTTSNKALPQRLRYIGAKTRVEFNGSCLKQDKVTFNHKTIVNIYIVYELSPTLNDFDPDLENCLFGAVKLTKNTDIDKYKYSGYGIGFDSRGICSFPSGGFGQNVIIFGAYMSACIYVDNKKKDILIIGEGPTQGLDDTTLTARQSVQLVLQ